MTRWIGSIGLALAALPLAALPHAAQAQTIAAAQPPPQPLELAGAITVDVATAAAGTGDRLPRLLSNVDLLADGDLAQLAGWRGARAHIHALDNHGARPNDAAGTLQGVDNIEVTRAGLRLFEAWVEQDFGRDASLRVGLYDLNGEFYTNDAAGLLIAPPFGIGSELAATGPNGPSIFPSSALAVRLRVPLAGRGGYAQFAAVNARASTLGDDGGIDVSFRDGLLLIAEAGTTRGSLRGSLGFWHYTHRAALALSPEQPPAPPAPPPHGAYLVLERDLLPQGARQLTAFLRAGRADPHASPFSGGVQTGLMLAPALLNRADSAVSVGLHHAWTNRDFKTAMIAAGHTPANGETAVELTYADRIAPRLALQPDLQWIRRPGADAKAPDAAVFTLRVTWEF